MVANFVKCNKFQRTPNLFIFYTEVQYLSTRRETFIPLR